MPHRIDVELTSTRDDETFTWRAAKARQPKGTVSTSMLPKGAKVGDVLRVEAEVELEGIRILSVVPAREKSAPTGRIEVIGSKEPVAGVTSVLAGPENRRRESAFFRDGSQRGGRDDSRGGRNRQGPRVASARAAVPTDDAPSGAGPEGRSRSAGERTERPQRGRSPSGERDRRPPARRDRHPGEAGPEHRTSPSGEDSAQPRPARSGRPGGGEGRGAAGDGRRAAGDGRSSGRGPERPARPVRKGPFRLEPGTKHRDELMDGLAPEQRPIAERLAAAAGSLPALRKAIADEQAKAKLEGRPFDGGEQILAIAEQLHPDVKAALWMDRAEAAVQHVDELSLRDLRAIVVAGAPRTDEGRELERALREALDRRVSKLRSDWEEHLTQALGEGRVLQALRLSARPPEPTARFPAGLVEGLAAQTSAAMNAETSPDRWLALLGAAELSPVKRQIRPAGIPEDPSGELHRKAAEAAGRIPALAGLLGMAMPPPPQPLPGERPVRPHPPRPPRPRAMGGGRPPRPRPAAGAPEQSPAVSATPETTQATAPMETPPPPVAEDTVASAPEPETLTSAPQPETVASTPESDTVASSPGADVVVSAPEPDSVTSPPDPDTLASAPEPETVASAPEPASSSSDSVGDTSDRAPDDTVVDQPVE